MPRLHKLRRRQKFQYNVNRKLLNKKRTKLPRIQCDAIRNAWDERKSLNDNLTSMGLIADTNTHKNFHIPSGKKQMEPKESIEHVVESNEVNSQSSVVSTLESQSNEKYKAKKAIAHPLPKELVKKLTGFLDKYGEDYEAMSRDYLNYNQETPAQLQSMVKRFKKIPQQWIPYLRVRGLLSPPIENEVQDAEFEIMPL